MDKDHNFFMGRCLELAKLGAGHTAPNPMVGCVIVHNGKIIGEGFHQKHGRAHAEVNAIASVKDKSLLKTSTIYVTLEPCSHYGKTPPCADLIIANEIPFVIVGTLDPNPLVAGNGIGKLQAHGCIVEIWVLEKECRELNRRFFTFMEKKRPYVILKWAETSDGFIDTFRKEDELGQPNWITDEMARISVHKQRANENAILVGTHTVEKDNPSLTVRDWEGNQPTRIVFDRDNRLPDSLAIFDNIAPTLVVTSAGKTRKDQVEYFEIQNGDSIDKLLSHLYEKKIQSVIVEGGSITLQRFIDSGLWDEAHVYKGAIKFGEGIKAPDFDSQLVYHEIFSKSELNVYWNQ